MKKVTIKSVWPDVYGSKFNGYKVTGSDDKKYMISDAMLQNLLTGKTIVKTELKRVYEHITAIA